MANKNRHLDDATWEGLACGELDDAARDAAFDHIVSCERCAPIWRGLLTLKSEAQAEGLIPRDMPAPFAWRSPVVALALAATLVVAVGSVLVTRHPVDQSALRGARAAQVEGLMMATDAAGVPTFIWTPVATATRYRIDVFSSDGLPIWTREVEAAPTRWPDDVPRTKGAYRWRVQAINAGEVVARSRLSPAEVVR